MTPELQRILRPKITPRTAARMHVEYLTGIAVTTGTLGMLWWRAYFEVWVEVMAPKGGDLDAA